MTAKDELLSILRAAREAADRTVRFRGDRLRVFIDAGLAAVRAADQAAEALYTPHEDGTVSRSHHAAASNGSDAVIAAHRETAEGYTPADAALRLTLYVVGPDGRTFRFHPDYPDHEETP